MEVVELGQKQAMMKERSSGETFENGGGMAGSKTPAAAAALLEWSRQPSDDHNNNAGSFRRCQVDDQGNIEEKEIVGWPPISSWRKRHLHDYQGMLNFY
nr:auxin-responsive protein IAA29 [Ipomoea trifida]